MHSADLGTQTVTDSQSQSCQSQEKLRTTVNIERRTKTLKQILYNPANMDITCKWISKHRRSLL